MLLQKAKFYSFLWLSSIPLYMCTHTRVCVSHLLHSSVDGHLGCFHILVIINNASMNIIWVHVSFQINIFFFSDISPGVELPGHIVVVFLVFWGTSILFSMVTAPIYIPTKSVNCLLNIVSNFSQVKRHINLLKLFCICSFSDVSSFQWGVMVAISRQIWV